MGTLASTRTRTTPQQKPESSENEPTAYQAHDLTSILISLNPINRCSISLTNHGCRRYELDVAYTSKSFYVAKPSNAETGKFNHNYWQTSGTSREARGENAGGGRKMYLLYMLNEQGQPC